MLILLISVIITITNHHLLFVRAEAVSSPDGDQILRAGREFPAVGWSGSEGSGTSPGGSIVLALTGLGVRRNKARGFLAALVSHHQAGGIRNTAGFAWKYQNIKLA